MRRAVEEKKKEKKRTSDGEQKTTTTTTTTKSQRASEIKRRGPKANTYTLYILYFQSFKHTFLSLAPHAWSNGMHAVI